MKVERRRLDPRRKELRERRSARVVGGIVEGYDLRKGAYPFRHA